MAFSSHIITLNRLKTALNNFKTYMESTGTAQYAEKVTKPERSNIISEAVDQSKLKWKTNYLDYKKWVGDTAPYTYDLGDEYKSRRVFVGFDSTNGNSSQLIAARQANIHGSQGTLLYAFGSKPTVNIPIVVTYI